jgi:CRISPR-associated protein (TIGR03986 family)
MRIKDETTDLAPGLLDLVQQGRADGTRVTFEYNKGLAKFIRWFGEDRAAAPILSSTTPIRSDRQRSFAEFANPYGFVPATPRSSVATELGDRSPNPLLRWSEQGVSGTIVCTFTTTTPLIISGRREEKTGTNGHFVFSTRTVGSKPYLSPTSVKGALRSAYEAITNSRFGVFSHKEHGDPLGFRMSTADGRDMVPAIVKDGKLELLTGTGRVGDMSKPNPIVHGALLPVYRNDVRKYPNDLPPHGVWVTADLQLVQHVSKRGVKDFRYWRVARLTWNGQSKTVQPVGESTRHVVIPNETNTASGYVFVTNRNMGNKHDERVFFFAGVHAQQTIPLTTGLREQYRQTVKSYQSLHSDRELHERRDRQRRVDADEWIARDPGKTAWSAHLVDHSRNELNEGSLCYVQFSAGSIVKGVYPVTIARGIHDMAPWDLLDESLRPATEISELSSADRLFGWVADGKTNSGPAAMKGRLRIRHIDMPESSVCIQSHSPALPLAILGGPKPQQGRFYSGSPVGVASVKPLEDEAESSKWFAGGRALRGRKQYAHHAGLPEGYWDPSVSEAELIGDRYQEYRRVPEAEFGFVEGKQRVKIEAGRVVRSDKGSLQDDQNRSITDWIREGTSFTVRIDVDDVSDVELGALLWLLRMPEGAMLKLGYGKPLGFGSVRVELDVEASSVMRGSKLRESYVHLRPTTIDGDANAEILETCFQEFRTVVARAAGTTSPESTVALKSFLQFATGDPGLVVHYPRVRPVGHDREIPVPPGIPSYKWFVENERNEKRSLPSGLAPLDILEER